MKIQLSLVFVIVATASGEVLESLCTGPGTIDCMHSNCAAYVPGTCYEITKYNQELIPDMQACYGDEMGGIYSEAAKLWNERVERGIPAIAHLQNETGPMAPHMQMDIALMFDHWDIIAMKIGEILASDPNDAHANFAKVMYGAQKVLPGIVEADVEMAYENLKANAPLVAKMVDRSLANIEMTWRHEFMSLFHTKGKKVCGSFMRSKKMRKLFAKFNCVKIPNGFNPDDLTILIFGANNDNILNARVATAKLLADRYPNAQILATGGALNTEKAEGDLIVEKMPGYEDRIFVDRLARDTIGNSIAIADFMTANYTENLFVVSSTFHVVRGASALRGVLMSRNMSPNIYLVGAGNHVQTTFVTGTEKTKENQEWIDTAYGGGGRFKAIEIPMTYRDYARGANLFTYCDFQAL